MEENFYELRFKKADFEFEIKGDKQFIESYFERMMSYLSPDEIDDLEFKNESKLDGNVVNEVPLDVFLNRYETRGLQQKLLAVALYFMQIKGETKFRGRDINKLLKENQFEPIDSTSIHIKRLREKGIISIVGKEGNESSITIYKENIGKALEFLKKEE